MNVAGLELTAWQVWLIGGAGALLSWLVVQRLALSRDRAARKATASANFRSTVFDILSSIPPTDKGWPSDVVARLPKILLSLGKAVNDFMPYLQSNQRQAFDREWRQLQGHMEYQIPGALSAARILYDHPTSRNDGMRPREAIERFHKHINRLLAYAQET